MTNELKDIEVAEARLLARGWPPFLAKASMDPFMYAIGLHSGLVVVCEGVRELPMPEGRYPAAFEWVELYGVTGTTVNVLSTVSAGRCSFDRGIQVRVSDIVWIADAPYGS